MWSTITKRFPVISFTLSRMARVLTRRRHQFLPKNSVKRPWFGKLYVNVACSLSRLWQLTQWRSIFTSRNAWTAAYCPWSRSMMVQYCFCRIWQQFTTQGTRWLSTNPIMSSSYKNWWIRQTVLKRKLLNFFGSNSKHTWGNTSSQQITSRNSRRIGRKLSKSSRRGLCWSWCTVFVRKFDHWRTRRQNLIFS